MCPTRWVPQRPSHPSQPGTSVMAIFFLSKDSRICCSSFWGGAQCGHRQGQRCPLLPPPATEDCCMENRPSPPPRPGLAPGDPPETAARRTPPPGTAPAAVAARAPCPPGAEYWPARGAVEEPSGQPQGRGQHLWSWTAWEWGWGCAAWSHRVIPGRCPLSCCGWVSAMHLPRPGPYSSSAPCTRAGTAALAPGGPPAAPADPDSVFSEGLGEGGREMGLLVIAASWAGDRQQGLGPKFQLCKQLQVHCTDGLWAWAGPTASVGSSLTRFWFSCSSWRKDCSAGSRGTLWSGEGAARGEAGVPDPVGRGGHGQGLGPELGDPPCLGAPCSRPECRGQPHPSLASTCPCLAPAGSLGLCRCISPPSLAM